MDADSRRLQRSRGLAAALMQQQAPQGQMVGGFYVAPNPLERIAALGSQYLGGRVLQRADQEEALAEKKQREENMRLAAVLSGAPEPGAMQNPQQAAAQQAFANIPVEAQQQFLGGQALQTLFPGPRKTERVDLGDRIGIVDEQGQLVGELPKGATPDATMREEGENARFAGVSGSARLSAETARRGQDLSAQTALRGQDITMRGQDMTDARAQEQLEVDRAKAAAAGTGKPLTEFQAKAVGQLARMQGAEQVVATMGDYIPSVTAKAAAALPGIGNKLTSEDFQNYQQAAREWISGVLRLDSGAAVPEQEFERYFATYFAQPGDGPDVIAQKADSRARAVDALRGSLSDIADRLPAPPQVAQRPAAPQGPALSENAMRYLLPPGGARGGAPY